MFIILTEAGRPISVNINHIAAFQRFQHAPKTKMIMASAGVTLEVLETVEEIDEKMRGE